MKGERTVNTFNNQQLRAWAERAQTHMADELALYGIDTDDVHLGTITPAMVRSVLAVVDIAPTPVAAVAVVQPEPQPIVQPIVQPVVQPVTPQLRKPKAGRKPAIPDPAEFEAEVRAALLAMAVDGQMPSQLEWDTNKPSHLPSRKIVCERMHMNWSQLAEHFGLRVVLGFESMQAVLREKWAKKDTEGDAAEPAAPFRNGNGRH